MRQTIEEMKFNLAKEEEMRPRFKNPQQIKQKKEEMKEIAKWLEPYEGLSDVLFDDYELELLGEEMINLRFFLNKGKETVKRYSKLLDDLLNDPTKSKEYKQFIRIFIHKFNSLISSNEHNGILDEKKLLQLSDESEQEIIQEIAKNNGLTEKFLKKILDDYRYSGRLNKNITDNISDEYVAKKKMKENKIALTVKTKVQREVRDWLINFKNVKADFNNTINK